MTESVYVFYLEWDIVPVSVEPQAELEARIERVAALTEPMIRRYAALYPGPIEVLPTWGTRSLLKVLVVRDDEPDGADETLAAREIKADLERVAPELAASLIVEGEYCK